MNKRNDRLANYKKVRKLQKKLKEQTNKTLQDSLFNLTELYNFDKLYDYNNILKIDSLTIDTFEQIRSNIEMLPIVNINSMLELIKNTMQNLQPMINLTTETYEVFNNFNNSIFNTSREVTKIVNKFSESLIPNIPSLTLSNLEIHTSLLNQIQHDTKFLKLSVAAYESFNNFALSNYNKLNNIITESNLNFQHIFNDIINKPLFNNIDFNSFSTFNQTFTNSLINDFTDIENISKNIIKNNDKISTIIENNFNIDDFVDEHIKQIKNSIKKYINSNGNINGDKIIIENLTINIYPEPKSMAHIIITTIFAEIIVAIILNIATFLYNKSITVDNNKDNSHQISHTAPSNFEHSNTIHEIVKQYKNNKGNKHED